MSKKNYIQQLKNARNLKVKRRFKDSIKEFESVLSVYKEIDVEDECRIYGFLAYLYLQELILDKAEIYARKNLELEKKSRDSTSNKIADAHFLLARVLAKKEKFHDAYECMQVALPIYDSFVSKNTSFYGNILIFLHFLEEKIGGGK